MTDVSVNTVDVAQGVSLRLVSVSCLRSHRRAFCDNSMGDEAL
jgi:hypothetical protein